MSDYSMDDARRAINAATRRMKREIVTALMRLEPSDFQAMAKELIGSADAREEEDDSQEEKLSRMGADILDCLEQRGARSVTYIAGSIGASGKMVERELERLTKRGMVSPTTDAEGNTAFVLKE